jgi:hypothetical protein
LLPQISQRCFLSRSPMHSKKFSNRICSQNNQHKKAFSARLSEAGARSENLSTVKTFKHRSPLRQHSRRGLSLLNLWPVSVAQNQNTTTIQLINFFSLIKEWPAVNYSKTLWRVNSTAKSTPVIAFNKS